MICRVGGGSSHVPLLAGTMESMHRTLKALWKRTSRRPATAEAELLKNMLLQELSEWQV